MLILGIFILIFIVLPIIWAIVDEDMQRSNKKVEDFYKEMEEKRRTEYAAMYTTEEVEEDEDDD